MLRKLTPFLVTFFAMLLDTAVIPALYHGIYTVPLTLAVAMCIGLTCGQLMGLLWGMVGGLLIDVTVGIMPVMTIYGMGVGFLIGLIVDEADTRPISRLRFHLRRATVSFVLYMLGEALLGVYRYFVTAAFSRHDLRAMLIRGAIAALLTVLLCPMLARLFHGRRPSPGRNQEVKNF